MHFSRATVYKPVPHVHSLSSRRTVLSERATKMQKELFTCYIDYEKAFNNVRHVELLFQELEGLALDAKDLRLLSELYW